MNEPLVSICIPTYNGATYIAEALDSAITQTYPNLEIVVSDDASTDDTLNVIETYKTKTHLPIHIYHHEPKGIGANWNNCIKNANGEYVKFLFQDDVLLPTCVEKMVKMAEKSEHIGLVYCKRNILYDSNLDFDKRWFKNFSELHTSWHTLDLEKAVLSGKIYLKDKYLLMPPYNKIGEPTAVLLRRNCFENIGYFSTNLKQALDLEFWYRFMLNYDIGFVNEPLIKFRLHSNQATQQNIKNPKLKIRESKILNNLILGKYFWYLHPSVQYSMIKQKLGIDEIEKLLKRIKRKLGKMLSGNTI